MQSALSVQTFEAPAGVAVSDRSDFTRLVPLMAKTNRISFGPMPFDAAATDEVLFALACRESNLGFVYVALPSVDDVVRLRRRERALLPLYKGAWINACESRILAALAKLAGRSLPVVSRTNLVDLLLKHIVKPLDRVNVIGDDFEVVRRLQAKYGLARISHHAPMMELAEQPEEIARCIDFIERHPARFTFLAVGSPQQEKIAHGAWIRGKAVGIGLCVGTALQCSTGAVANPPCWMRGAGLEWLHRLMTDTQL